MTYLRTALLLLAGASLLVACGPKGGGNTAASSASEAASAAPSGGADVAIDPAAMPVPRAGLWETTTSVNGGPPKVARHCEDGKPVDVAKLKQNCSSFTVKKTALGDYVVDASCGDGKTTSVLHATMRGDPLGGSYETDGVTTMSMPGRQPLKNANHTTAKYIGPCPPGEGAG